MKERARNQSIDQLVGLKAKQSRLTNASFEMSSIDHPSIDYNSEQFKF
jgi:hypothetical protein